MGCSVERVSLPTFHARQFDPRKQQCQIGRVHFDVSGAWQREWSLESPAFQTLHPNGQPVAIPIHQLESIPSAIEKQKQITRAHVTLELGLDDGVQAIEALAHVDVLGIEVDSRWRERHGKRQGLHRFAPCSSGCPRRLHGTRRYVSPASTGRYSPDSESRPNSPREPIPRSLRSSENEPTDCL